MKTSFLVFSGLRIKQVFCIHFIWRDSSDSPISVPFLWLLHALAIQGSMIFLASIFLMHSWLVRTLMITKEHNC